MNDFRFLSSIILFFFIILKLFHQKSCFYLRAFHHLQIVNWQNCFNILILNLICIKKWCFKLLCLIHHKLIFLSLNWVNLHFFHKSGTKWIKWLLLNWKLFLIILKIVQFNILVIAWSWWRNIIILISFRLQDFFYC